MSSTITSNALLLFLSDHDTVNFGAGFVQKESMKVSAGRYITLHVQQDSNAVYPDLIFLPDTKATGQSKNLTLVQDFMLDLPSYGSMIISDRERREIKRSHERFDRAVMFSVPSNKREYLENEVYKLFHPD